MSTTYLAAVRFTDGSKMKFKVSDVPDEHKAILEIIQQELSKDYPPVTTIMLRIK